MLKILAKIIRFNTIIVVGIYRTDAGNRFYTLTVKKIGSSLDIVRSAVYSDQESFFKNLDIKAPHLVVIDGKGVLNKKIDYQSESDIRWKKNLASNTVYSTEIKSEEYSLLSFCRKGDINAIIGDLQKRKVDVLNVYVGPLYASLLKHAIKDEVIISNTSVLNFHNGHCSGITKSSLSDHDVGYVFDNYELTPFQMPLYGAAAFFYINHNFVTASKCELIDQDEIYYKKTFKNFAIGMVALFFFALLISYISIQVYSRKNVELQQEKLFSNYNYQQLTALEKQRDEKRQILDETGQLSENFLSYYGYELSKSAPYGLVLNELSVCPFVNEVKANERIKVQPYLIIVKGAAKEEFIFNQWLTYLEKMPWITKFEILSLKQDRNHIQQFTIKIVLNNV